MNYTYICGGKEFESVLAAQKLVNQDKIFIMAGHIGTAQNMAAMPVQFEKNIIETVDLRSVRQIGFANAQGVGKKIIDLFEKGEFDVCTLFFSRFRSVVAQIPTAQQLIPAEVKGDATASPYECEPSEEAILADLLPRNVSTQIFRALLENAASEQGARMSAMDNATRNAGEMISKLTITYNRSRQATITKELIEIISGAEAV